MEDLIARIATDAGVEPGIAEKAVGLILAFLRKEGPKDEVDALFAALPGAAEAADAAASEDGGGGMGGGLMGLAGQLTGLGLGMGEMQTVGRPAHRLCARESRRRACRSDRRGDPRSRSVSLEPNVRSPSDQLQISMRVTNGQKIEIGGAI